MIPWHLLDFSVVVPAERLGLPFRRGHVSFGSESAALPRAFSVVGVTVGGTAARPGWELDTLPRRGIRPLDLDRQGPLTADVDITEAAAGAVCSLLLRAVPFEPDADAAADRVARADGEGEEVGVALSLPLEEGGPWQQELALVGEEHFAIWIHRRDSGWAAVMDLGWAVVTATGAGCPPPWVFAVLPACRAAEVLGGDEIDAG
ncbi:MAG: hypothetical protein PGN11_04985 [Quadrisphaera sp.]